MGVSSTGVCVWEIFSMAQQPFYWLENGQVINQLESGVRLHKPQQCPPPIYGLLTRCWAYEPHSRPTFRDLVLSFRCTHTLLQMSGFYFSRGWIVYTCLLFDSEIHKMELEQETAVRVRSQSFSSTRTEPPPKVSEVKLCQHELVLV